MAWGVVLCNCLQRRADFAQPRELGRGLPASPILAVKVNNTAFASVPYCVENARRSFLLLSFFPFVLASRLVG